ncbi:MAG: hypothetical protein IKI93_06150, partial [Clostridia bacterium]|nr:hypothetical protein [Clostridia bacterium]
MIFVVLAMGRRSRAFFSYRTSPVDCSMRMAARAETSPEAKAAVRDNVQNTTERIRALLKIFITTPACEHLPEITRHESGLNFRLQCSRAVRGDAMKSEESQGMAFSDVIFFVFLGE